MSPPLRRARRRISCGAASRSTICRPFDRPLSVLHEEQEELRRRFLENPQRRIRHRDADEPRLRRGVRAGRISLNRFVELTSTSPAKIFGLFPRKGTIAPGSDADVVVFDPNRTITLSARTLHMKVDYNPYEGRQVTGAADTVLSRGRLVIENGKFVGRAGAGSFIKRAGRS